jgi:DNA mismatch repair ATPase MutS
LKAEAKDFDGKMNKQQNRLLGLDKIYDLIEVPGNMLEAVKRYKINVERLSLPALEEAYKRRALFMEELKNNTHPKWNQLFAHIEEIRPQNFVNRIPAIHELFELKSFVFHYLELIKYARIRGIVHYDFPELQELFRLLDPEGSGIPFFRLSPLYSSLLQECDTRRQDLSRRLKHSRALFLDKARRDLAIDNLKEEFVIGRNNHDLLLKIQNSNFFILKRENIANLIFMLADSPESMRIKEELALLNKEIEAEEHRILGFLAEKIACFEPEIKRAIAGIKEAGWDFSLASFAVRYRACLPEIGESIELVNARNLPLEIFLNEHKRLYQPLYISFSSKANLITGPNMGGKTSILKCLAQFAHLVRRGIPLPAEKLSMPLYDFIYYNHANEGDNLSSFGAEVVAFCQALNQKGRGLFLLDEFAKGTNPREGEAIATAVITYLSRTDHTTVAATHFTAPALLKDINQYQIKGIESQLDNIVNEDIGQRLRILAEAMDYNLIRLSDNQKPPMDALRIARILGLPEEILELTPKEQDCLQ